MGSPVKVLMIFKECKIQDAAGEVEVIPAGRYIVTEQDLVTVEIDGKSLELDQATFDALKKRGLAYHPLGF